MVHTAINIISKPVSELSTQEVARVATLLQRPARGLLAIECADKKGEPAVLRVAPLVDQKPFPTLFWLVHPDICYWLDGLEANGVIAQLQLVVDENVELQQELTHYHHWYIAERWRSATPELIDEIVVLGYRSALDAKGVGGLGDYTRIRCLHTWYGAHLVRSNPVGRWLDDSHGCLLINQKN